MLQEEAEDAGFFFLIPSAGYDEDIDRQKKDISPICMISNRIYKIMQL